jgi:hypothetical protein
LKVGKICAEAQAFKRGPPARFEFGALGGYFPRVQRDKLNGCCVEQLHLQILVGVVVDRAIERQRPAGQLRLEADLAAARLFRLEDQRTEVSGCSRLTEAVGR